MTGKSLENCKTVEENSVSVWISKFKKFRSRITRLEDSISIFDVCLQKGSGHSSEKGHKNISSIIKNQSKYETILEKDRMEMDSRK